MISENDRREMVAKIRHSKKYKRLSPDIVERMVQWASLRHSKIKEIEKLAKKKLHQVYALYLHQFEPRIFEQLFEQINPGLSSRDLENLCLQLMEQHVSTRERLPYMEVFYEKIFNITGKPKVIVDLACGLQPLAYPWLQQYSRVNYYAYDLDFLLLDFLNRFFKIMSYPGQAFAQDLLVQLPLIKADIIFLLKTLPCLEQQEKGISLRLLKELDYKYLVVSFPGESIGGKNKGMPAFYHDFMLKLINDTAIVVEQINFSNEIVYILQKKE